MKYLKKKETEALSLKTDSFVVETNVHFPTDYNLLWDCARKCLDTITKLKKQNDLPGWRKIRDWYSDLKNKSRAVGRAGAAGGKNKQEKLREKVTEYLDKSKKLHIKLIETKQTIRASADVADILLLVELEHYMGLLAKHINLLERRVIKGEQIPHHEKMFSIFEPYTEWIQKGKLRPNVELGKKVAITSDQYQLIISYSIMENESDNEVIEDIYRLLPKTLSIKSWSFDKGYWSKNNKEFLSQRVDLVIMPKKGKLNKQEYEEEHRPEFKKYRNLHSAVESNINELEHRGLNRCPNKGFKNFKQYVAIAVSSFNLKKIGEKILEEQREKAPPSLRKSA